MREEGRTCYIPACLARCPRGDTCPHHICPDLLPVDVPILPLCHCPSLPQWCRAGLSFAPDGPDQPHTIAVGGGRGREADGTGLIQVCPSLAHGPDGARPVQAIRGHALVSPDQPCNTGAGATLWKPPPPHTVPAPCTPPFLTHPRCPTHPRSSPHIGAGAWG